jgi:hypothetical protein
MRLTFLFFLFTSSIFAQELSTGIDRMARHTSAFSYDEMSRSITQDTTYNLVRQRIPGVTERSVLDLYVHAGFNIFQMSATDPMGPLAGAGLSFYDRRTNLVYYGSANYMATFVGFKENRTNPQGDLVQETDNRLLVQVGLLKAFSVYFDVGVTYSLFSLPAKNDSESGFSARFQLNLFPRKSIGVKLAFDIGVKEQGRMFTLGSVGARYRFINP